MGNNIYVDDLQVINAVKPQTGGSARSGDWISLKNAKGVLITVDIAMGAANTTAITVDKATDVSATGESTGITLNNWWKRTDAGVVTKGTAAASITSSATGSGYETFLIYIDADELPNSTADYDCIQVELGSSSASNLVSASYILFGQCVAVKPAIQPDQTED